MSKSTAIANLTAPVKEAVTSIKQPDRTYQRSTYCDDFEKMYAIGLRQEPWEEQIVYEPSTIYQVPGEERPDLGMGFVNGMDNDFECAKESAEYLSRLAGGYCVHAVFNATHGKRVDIIECKLGLELYCLRTRTADPQDVE